MIYHFDDQQDTEQLRARQVGESSPVLRQQPQVREGSMRQVTEIDQQVERVRWLMQREPMLEGGN